MSASATRLVGRRGRDRHLVVGGSELGALIAGVLASRGLRVDLIDRDPVRCRELATELPKVTLLLGDATDLGFMKDIRFDESEGVVSVTHQEEVNLLTSMLVRQLESPAVRGVPHAWVSVHRPGYAELCRRLGIEGTTSSFEVLSRAILEAIAPALRGLWWTCASRRPWCRGWRWRTCPSLAAPYPWRWPAPRPR